MDQELMKALEALNQATAKQADEIKAAGAATVETKSEIDALRSQVNELVARLNAPGAGVEAKGETADDVELKSFVAYLRGEEIEEKALDSGNGGVLLPGAIEMEIHAKPLPSAIVRRYASAETINTDRVKRNTLTRPTFSFGVLEKGATHTQQNLTPSEEWVYVEDMQAEIELGRNLLADSPHKVQDKVAQVLREAKGVDEEKYFFTGTGHANSQPEGVMVEASIPHVQSAANGAVSLDDLIELELQLPEQYRTGSIYVVSKDVYRVMRTKKSSDGTYLWQAGNMAAGVPETFNGFPVFVSGHIAGIPAAASATTNKVGIFGNFGMGYKILDREGITVERFDGIELRRKGVVSLFAQARVAGAVVDSDAFRTLRVTAA